MNRIRRQVTTFRTAAVALAMLALLLTAAAQPAQAQTFTSLHTFQGVLGVPVDGAVPQGLVQATNGYLYGTTSLGGAANEGTVFKINTSGVDTTLWSFDVNLVQGDGDGTAPQALMLASDGNFYGATSDDPGGCSGPNGSCGVVYKITQGGAMTVIYHFCAVGQGADFCQDGSTPPAALVQASNGVIYGANQAGGAYGQGTIFKITTGGALTTLHAFCSVEQFENCPDGAPSYSALVQGTDGNLYGTTEFGGSNFFGGTAFRLTQAGVFTTLHTFGSKGDLGTNPTGGLVQGADGNFYGTTVSGGSAGHGTFYKMTPRGLVTTLYSFCFTGVCTDGAMPGALVLATDGNFYGLTVGGGINYGTIFQITPSGTLTTLHTFDGTDGFNGGTLMQDTNGTLYGTTLDGGFDYTTCNGCNGTVFSVSMGLAPFVETLPTSGKVGASIKILGTNLKGATSVSFNGVPATFKVASNSEITATVPTGATTGEVKVATPKNTLNSNVVFRVP